MQNKGEKGMSNEKWVRLGNEVNEHDYSQLKKECYRCSSMFLSEWMGDDIGI